MVLRSLLASIRPTIFRQYGDVMAASERMDLTIKDELALFHLPAGWFAFLHVRVADG